MLILKENTKTVSLKFISVKINGKILKKFKFKNNYELLLYMAVVH